MSEITYVSLGWRCFTPSILRHLGLRDKAFPFDWFAFHRIEAFHSIIANRYETFIGDENWFAVPRAEDGVNATSLYNRHHRGVLMNHPTDRETRARRVRKLQDALSGGRVVFVRFEIRPNGQTLRLAGSIARRAQAPVLLIFPPDRACIESDRLDIEEEERLAEVGEVLVVRTLGPATMAEYGAIYDLIGDTTGLDWSEVFNRGKDLRERFESRDHHFFLDEETKLAELTVDELSPSDFDGAMYRSINPNVEDYWDAKYHYVEFGVDAGLLYHLRDAPPDFDPDAYRRLNPDLESLTPDAATAHLVIYGRGEGRAYKAAS